MKLLETYKIALKEAGLAPVAPRKDGEEGPGKSEPGWNKHRMVMPDDEKEMSSAPKAPAFGDETGRGKQLAPLDTNEKYWMSMAVKPYSSALVNQIQAANSIHDLRPKDKDDIRVALQNYISRKTNIS